MSRRDNLLLVQDMLEAALKIESYTLNYCFDDFINDDKTSDAVVRNFEIIGEAASRVNPDFQDENSGVPWKKLKGYRNRLIHEYFGVDYKIVWDIIQDELPDLIGEIRAILDFNSENY